MKPHVVGTGPCDKMDDYNEDEDYDLAWQEDEDDYWYEGYYDEFQDDEDDYNPRQKVEAGWVTERYMHDDDDEDED